MRRAVFGWVGLIVGPVLLAGCGRKAAEPAAAAEPATTLVQVRPDKVTQVVADETLPVTGSIEADTDVVIASKVGGRVVAIGAQEGQRVANGRVLVQLDAAAARGQVQQAEAAVRSARANLNKAILSTNLVATQTDSGVRTAQAALNAAKARESSARSSLRIAQTKSGSEGVDVSQARASVATAQGKLRQARQALLIAQQKATSDVESADAAIEQANVAVNAARTRVSQGETSLALAEATASSNVTTSQQALYQAQNQLAMLQEGARGQERGQAQSALIAAQAALRTAEADYNRAKMLFEGGAVARASMDAAQLRLDSAREQARQAELQNSLVVEGPRQQQLAIAQAQVASAQDQFNLATANRDRTISLRRDDLANAKEDVTRAEAQLRQANAAAATARAARAQVPISEADVANAEQGVATAEAALRLAEAGVNSTDIAKNELAAAQQAVAQAEQGLRNAQAARVQPSMTQQDISGLRGMLAGAEGSLRVAQANLRDHTILAPISGGVADKNVEVGSVVSPGLMLYRLVGDNFVNFKAVVPEEKLRFVNIGDSVKVNVDAQPDEAYVGRVVEILPAADERSRSFKVKIGLPNPGGKLRQGMFARGSIVVQRNKRTLRVPVTAVSRRDDRSWVVKLEGTKAIPVEVELGGAYAGLVEIAKGNLAAGDTIAVEGGAEITSEQQVELIANAEPTKPEDAAAPPDLNGSKAPPANGH